LQNDEPEPTPADSYDGNLFNVPSTTARLTKLPVSYLREILYYHNVVYSGTKSELALRIILLHQNRKHLAFQREVRAILALITTVANCILDQKELELLSENTIYRKRACATLTKPQFNLSRPRQSAAAISQDQTSFSSSVQIPIGLCKDNIQTLFSILVDYIHEHHMSTPRSKQTSGEDMQAFTTPGTRVLVRWNEEDVADSGYNPGWYTATILDYKEDVDELSIRYTSETEFDISYEMKLAASLKEGVIRLAREDIDNQLYDEVTEVGARLLVKGKRDELKACTNVKPGRWYAAEVQSYDPEEDEIDVMFYIEKDRRAYPFSVTKLISENRVKLSTAK
jgi:hypothetical protein